MGINGDDAGCPARDYIKGDNGRLNLSTVKHSDSRSAFLGTSLSTASSRKEVDMTTQYHQVMTKILIVVAFALGSSAGAAAPAGADPNPIGSAPNSFGGLTCSCRETAPPGSPVLREEIEQGIREGRTAWLPGLSTSTQPRQSP
jgi:hypothetical protein